MARVGLGSQYGAAVESTAGTYVAPTRFLPFTSVSGTLNQDWYKSKGLQPGIFAQQDVLTMTTTRSGTFNVSREVLTKGEGMFLNQLHGATVTPTTTTAPAFSQAHPIGNTLPEGRTLTQQYLAPGTNNTQNVVTALGSVPLSAKFSIEKGGVLSADYEYFASDLNYSQTLATATYASAPALFPFDKATLLVGGSTFATPVHAYEVTFTLPRDTERYSLAGSATPLEALTNDYISVAGSLTVELGDTTTLAAVQAGTTSTLKLTCLSRATIATARYAKFEIDLQGVHFLPHSAAVSGPGVITMTVPFEGVVVAGQPLGTINYESLDTAL